VATRVVRGVTTSEPAVAFIVPLKARPVDASTPPIFVQQIEAVERYDLIREYDHPARFSISVITVLVAGTYRLALPRRAAMVSGSMKTPKPPIRALPTLS